MNYIFSEITFPSADGIHTIYAEIYTPKGVAPKGVVQLCHGMRDYVGRYQALAEYLTSEGYIFAGHAHLGHGKSADDEGRGYFAESDGVLYLLKDIHSMNKYLRSVYPTLPLWLLGHSMGSFLARLYTNRHPHSIQGLIIHGTAGPNPALPFGKLAVKIGKMFHGDKYRSNFVASLAFMGYNSRFPKSEGEHAWLTREIERVAGRDTDPYTNFTFTLSAFGDLFSMLGAANSKAWFDAFPKELPTLIISGDADPVGSYGKGPEYVYKHLLLSGCSSVTLKLFENCRHELFNESNREQIFDYIGQWISSNTK